MNLAPFVLVHTININGKTRLVAALIRSRRAIDHVRREHFSCGVTVAYIR